MTAACPRFAFTVELSVRPAAAAELDRLRRDFVAFLDENGLTFTGGQGSSPRFLISRDAGQATNEDRHAVSEWTGRRPEIAAARIGELIDLRD